MALGFSSIERSLVGDRIVREGAALTSEPSGRLARTNRIGASLGKIVVFCTKTWEDLYH
jgi:hypothetical protein